MVNPNDPGAKYLVAHIYMAFQNKSIINIYYEANNYISQITEE